MSASENSSETPLSPTTTASSQAKSESSTSSIRSLLRGYNEKKKAKAAAKKVDYYEKEYGFVPKNVMTEDEWKRAKKNGPIVKLPLKLKATAYQGHYW